MSFALKPSTFGKPASILSAAVACAMTSGCSTLMLADAPPQPTPTRLKTVLAPEAERPAPRGLLEYCARTEACGATSSALTTGGEAVTESFVVDADLELSATENFFRMMAAAAAGSSGTPLRVEERLNRSRWRELVWINRYVNRAIAPDTDQARYGEIERWTTPIRDAARTGARARGDCEDYALEKRERLLAAGWSPEAVLLAIARLPDGRLHTVVLVQTDIGDMVLDNLRAGPQALGALPYEWISRQTGADLRAWSNARVALIDAFQTVALPTRTPFQ